MIDLFSSDTPNGKKISIMLEEIGFEYAVKKMDLSKGDQFKEDFKDKTNLNIKGILRKKNSLPLSFKYFNIDITSILIFG